MVVSHRGVRSTRSEDVRRGNLSALLRHVHVHGPTARSRLAAELDLNRSTIGVLTGELVGAGLVREVAGRVEKSIAGAASSGGRPSHVVVPESGRLQVLAVDIGVTHLSVARIGLGGVVLGRRDRVYLRGNRRQGDVTAAIVQAARDLASEVPRGAVLVGAGVAVPGMVRRVDGHVRLAPNLGWEDTPLGALLGDALGLPVSVGNDADLGIRAEHVRGAAAGVEDAVYLSGHAGLGAGILAGGLPLSGRTGYAGEVGHTVVNPNGRPCHCGSRGCWETECGEERLLELAGRTSGGGGITAIREVAWAARSGDPVARAAVEHVARWLGRGTANVVNYLNPEVVILGGFLEVVLESAGDVVRTAFSEAALAAPREQVRLVPPALGHDSTLMGAAELAFDALLSDPLPELSRRTAV